MSSSSSSNRQQRYKRDSHNGTAVSARPPAYDPIIVEESSITQSDLHQLLNSSKRTGTFVCLSPTKKEILGEIVKHHSAITAALGNVDIQNIRDQRDSAFKTRFESCIQKCNTQIKINRSSNTLLSNQMVDLFSILKEVIDHNKFRSVSKHVRRLVTTMHEAVEFLVIEKADGKETVSILRGEKRTNQQLERKFLEGGGTLPRDELLSRCAFCKHGSVDWPPENETVQSENELRFGEHAKVVAKWNKHKEGKGPCPKTATGKLYTRCPPPPKTESLLLQCHCHQMACSRKGSLVGSTCIIGCCKANGEAYEWSEGACACPICCCPCKKGYAIGNIMKIGLELTHSKTTGGVDRNSVNEQLELFGQAEVKKFLSECMVQGAQVAQSSLDIIDQMNKQGM
jgi:hypothetical protein